MRGYDCPNLVVWPETIEGACEFVNHMRQWGFVPTRVQLQDKGLNMDLPIEIFDGQSFLEPMHQLQNDWRKLIEGD